MLVGQTIDMGREVEKLSKNVQSRWTLLAEPEPEGVFVFPLIFNFLIFKRLGRKQAELYSHAKRELWSTPPLFAMGQMICKACIHPGATPFVNFPKSLV